MEEERVLRETFHNQKQKEQGSCTQADEESQKDAPEQGLLISGTSAEVLFLCRFYYFFQLKFHF